MKKTLAFLALIALATPASAQFRWQTVCNSPTTYTGWFVEPRGYGAFMDVNARRYELQPNGDLNYADPPVWFSTPRLIRADGPGCRDAAYPNTSCPGAIRADGSVAFACRLPYGFFPPLYFSNLVVRCTEPAAGGGYCDRNARGLPIYLDSYCYGDPHSVQWVPGTAVSNFYPIEYRPGYVAIWDHVGQFEDADWKEVAPMIVTGYPVNDLAPSAVGNVYAWWGFRYFASEFYPNTFPLSGRASSPLEAFILPIRMTLDVRQEARYNNHPPSMTGQVRIAVANPQCTFTYQIFPEGMVPF